MAKKNGTRGVGGKKKKHPINRWPEYIGIFFRLIKREGVRNGISRGSRRSVFACSVYSDEV